MRIPFLGNFASAAAGGTVLKNVKTQNIDAIRQVVIVQHAKRAYVDGETSAKAQRPSERWRFVCLAYGRDGITA